MIKLKPKGKQKASEQAKKEISLRVSSRSGTTPPIHSRFKPGQSGNPGGRPKFIREAYTRVLQEKTKIKVVREDDTEEEIIVPRYEAMARKQIDVATTFLPHGVSAARDIRQLVEPTEEEERGSSDRDFTRLVAALLLERRANAIEV